MLSRQDAAEFLRCTQQTVSNYVSSGVLKGHKINGRLFVDADTLYAIADTVDDIETAKKRIAELRDECETERRALEDAVNEKREELALYKSSPVSRLTRFAVTSMIRSFSEVLPRPELEVLVDLVNNGNPDYTAQKMDTTVKNVIKAAERACGRMRIARYDKKVKENEYLRKRIAELERENECLRKGVACGVGEQDNPVLKYKISDCDFSVRTITCMKAIGIETVGDLLGTSIKEIAKYRNVGRKTIAELENFAETNGLKLK